MASKIIQEKQSCTDREEPFPPLISVKQDLFYSCVIDTSEKQTEIHGNKSKMQQEKKLLKKQHPSKVLITGAIYLKMKNK